MKKRVKIVCGKRLPYHHEWWKIKLACKLPQPYISYNMLCSNIAEEAYFFYTSLVKGRISLVVLLSTLGKRMLVICICNSTAGLLRVQPCLCTVAIRNYSGNFVFWKRTHTQNNWKQPHQGRVAQIVKSYHCYKIVICNKSYDNHVKALILLS